MKTFMMALVVTACWLVAAHAQQRTCHQTCNRIGSQTQCTQYCN